MTRLTVPLGRIFGISIILDYSCFLIFSLMTWLLASSYFPAEFKNWSPPMYWGTAPARSRLVRHTLLADRVSECTSRARNL